MSYGFAGTVLRQLVGRRELGKKKGLATRRVCVGLFPTTDSLDPHRRMTSTEVDYSITVKTNGPGTYSLVSGCPPFATGTWTLEVLAARVLDATACRMSWTGVTDAVYTTNTSVSISYAAPGPAQMVYAPLSTRFIGTDGACPSVLPAGSVGFTVSRDALDSRMSSLTFKFSLDPSNQPFKLKPDPTPTNVFAARSTGRCSSSWDLVCC
jgi:hypothetical protein